MKKAWFWLGAASFIIGYDIDTQVFAETQPDIVTNIIEREKNIEENQNKLDELLLEISKQEEELAVQNEEIKKIEEEIKQTDEKVLVINQKIQTSKNNIIIQEEELEKGKITLERSLKLMHEKGDVTFLEFLFRSDSVSTFLYRFQLLKDVNAQHKEIIEQIQYTVNQLEEQKRTELKLKNELQLEILKQTQSRKKINEIKMGIENLIASINEKYASIQNEIVQDQEIVKQMIFEMQELSLYEGYTQEQVQEQSDNAVITGNDIVDIAYKWVLYRGIGSKNPVIYSMPNRQLSLQTYGDCSAFSRRVYMDAGYGHIGYTTADQIANPNGEFIEKVEDLLPGDLMYFGPTGSHVVYSYLPNGKKVATAHVAIYVGNGKMIDLAAGVGSISIKDFSQGGSWEWYVKNRWVGGKRFEKLTTNN